MKSYDGPSFDEQYPRDDQPDQLVEHIEQEQDTCPAAEDQQPEQLPEVIKVQIVDAFGLGFFFGLGLILALVFPAFIGFVIFITIVKEAML